MAAARSNVVDLFSQEQYTGGNGIADLDSKLGSIGLAEVEQMREDCFNVSNLMFILVIGCMISLTIISGAQSVVTGYLTGGDNETMAILNATRMALFQLTLLSCGIVIGCWIGDTANKDILAFLCLALGGLLMVVTIATGLAFAYYIQDIPAGDSTTPIQHFFASYAKTSSTWTTAEEVQAAFNWYCVIVFEFAVVITPILFKVLNCPMREKWEVLKRVKAYMATEKSKQLFITNIAKTESKKLKVDAAIYREKRKTEMQTRADVMNDMLSFEGKMADMWMKRKGIWARAKYKLSGIHDADDEFIKYATNHQAKAEQPQEKKH